MGIRGHVGLLAVVGATAGCAQVFGIDDTTGGDAGAVIVDAPPKTSASLEFDLYSVGTSIARAPLDLSAQTATFYIPDATAPSGLISEPGTFAAGAWTAPAMAGAPSVVFTLPDLPTPIPRLYDFGTLDQRGLFGILEHPNAVPAPANASFAISVALDRAYSTESFQLYTLGSWTDTGLAPPVAGAGAISASLPFASTGNLSGRPLVQLTIDDAVLVLRFTGSTLDGVLSVAPFAQVAGANAINGTLHTIAQDQTLDVQVDPTVPGQRFSHTLPAVSSVTMNWDVTAAPGYAIGQNNGPQLTAGSVLATGTGTIHQVYGNPFAGRLWPATLIWSTAASRMYTPPGSPALALSAGLYQLAPPSPALHLTLPQGLPTQITMAGQALTADGMMIGLDPVKAVDVSFVSDQPVNTFYQLAVYELVGSPASGTSPATTVYANRMSASGTQPAFSIPRNVFQVGHTYTLRAICVVGDFPTIAAGNLQNRDLPLAIGYLDSGAFTVTS